MAKRIASEWSHGSGFEGGIFNSYLYKFPSTRAFSTYVLNGPNLEAHLLLQ